MNILLTMAGKYSRFRLFANQVPKYLMPLGKNTILWHVIAELKCAAPEADFYFIANKDDRDFFPVISSILEEFSICSENLIYIGDTKSQLETALALDVFVANKKMNVKKPIAFGNIDTVVRARHSFFNLLSEVREDEAVVDCFQGSSAAYSYVKPNNKDELEFVADNIRVSEFACSGLYGFSSVEFFTREAVGALKDDETANFTKVYQRLLNSKFRTLISYSNEGADTLVLGTPEEYIVNLHKVK